MSENKLEFKNAERVALTDLQKEILSDFYRRKVEAEKGWANALALAGVDKDRIIRGDLEAGYFDLKPEEEAEG